ncbi:MAG: CARDB domain-containing protein [Paludibacter sp.]|nr:CARDB domain-containing protein [Paludibacter sp.]
MKKQLKYVLISGICMLLFSMFPTGKIVAQTIGFSFSNINVMQKDTFTVSMNADSLLTGKGIYAFKVGLTYNSYYVEYLGIDSVGAPMKSWGLPTINKNTPGTLLIAGAGAQPLTEKGKLFYLRFRAKTAGYTTIDNIGSFSQLNEGKPAMTLNSGYVNCGSISYPDIYPDNSQLYVGETVQMTVYGGTSPFTYGSADPTIASIDATGKVTAMAPGTAQIYATDAKGNKNYTSGVMDVRAVKLSILNSGATLLDTFYLPVKIEIAPGTKVYSGSFQLSFNTNLKGVVSSIQAVDYPVSVQNNVSGTVMKISFASANGLTGTGILCKVAMIAVNSGTHTVDIQSVVCNDNLAAFTYSGTVGVECKPCNKVTGMMPVTGSDNLNSAYLDLYWQPSLNTRYYNLFLWEEGKPIPTNPYQSGIYGTSTRVNNLKSGNGYLWKIVSINECSAIESDVQTFLTKPLPDLIVTDILAPKEIESGSQFTVSFKVKNTGQTGTVSGQWMDAVYISTDSTLNGSKWQMMSKYNSGQLAVNESYTQSYVLTMPAEYTGKYYLFVATDTQNSIAELFDNNNMGRYADSVKVSLKPFPDILVKDIQAVGTTLVPGDSLRVNWNVQNIGNADGLGGWSEQLTLVSASGKRVTLSPTLTSNTDLAAGKTQARSYKFKIPEVLRFSGTASIEVQLYPSGTFIEHSGTDANNRALSANSVTTVETMYLDVSATALSEASTGEVRCVVTRSGDYTSDLLVNVTNTPPGQITIPASVTIPANMSSTIFNLTAIDNTVVDGTRNVKIVVSAPSYRNDTSTIQILDNEATALKATLNKTVAAEGDSLKLRITRNLITSSPITVYLSTNKPNQWIFNNAATIPANDSVVVVPVYVINDNAPELNETCAITINSGGFASGSVSAMIIDDDMPELEFTLSNDTVQEAAGMYATYGTIKRKSGTGNITINFSASLDNTLILPSSITIPKGTNEVKFNIGVVDNTQVDGYRKVLITGAVYVASCSCNSSPDNGVVVTKNLVIADNDGPCLTASVNPVSLFEGRTNAGKLIITRNTDTTNSILVSILSSDTTQVKIQPTATIPAGQKSVEVPINTINNGIQNGTQTINLTVQSAGFGSGFCTVYVSDINKPDFVNHHVAVSKTTVLTNDTLQVSGRLINLGYLNAPLGSKIGFYLSKDDYVDTNDQLLGTFVTTSQILMGDSVPFNVHLSLSSKTGSYKLLVHANPNNAVNELVYTNNTYDPISIQVVPEYTATATVDLTQTLPNKAVTIYGKATRVTKQPAASVKVDVYLLSNGTRKVLTAITDAQGNYSVQFTPMIDESGHFDIGACYPDEGLNTIQDAFDILGVKRTSTDYITWLTKVGDPYIGTLQVKNTSNIELKNVQMKLANMPTGCTLTVSPIASLPGNATAVFNYTVLGTVRSTTTDYQKLKLSLTSDEGVSLGYDAYYYCQEQQAVFETSPASINTTVSKGTTKYLEFTLTNRGGGESGVVHITLPAVSFMSLVSSDSILNIKPSETVSVTLKIMDTDLALNTPVNGNIAINCEHGKGMTVPYKIEAVSNAMGSLKIDVMDEYTYNTTEAPHVKNAHVVVRHPFSGVILADGFTDANGIFTADKIPEGYYTMTVEAEKHDGYRNNIIIDAGKTLSQSIFISFQAITYTWNVVRTEVADEYKVDLIMKFETNVPAPVVVMEMPDTMPHLINDETYPFMVTVTNKGLITATDLTLTFPADPEYEFVTNFTKMDLLAQQSIQIPVVMKRKATFTGVNGMLKVKAEDLNCFAVVVEGHGFYCGPDKKWHEGVQLFNFAGRVCIGSATGGGSGPGGEGGPSLGGGTGGYVYVVPNNNGSTVSVNNVYECDNCLMDLALTALGCLPGPIGPIMGVVSCIKSFADADGITFMDVVNCGVGFIPGWGCVYGLFQVALSCYQDPPRLFVRPYPFPQNAPQGAPKPLMPPILKQAFTDLGWVIHSMNAERAWMKEFTGIDSLYMRVNFADFASAIDSFTTYKKEMQPLDMIAMNQKLYGTDILPTELEAFAARWNSTLQAYSRKVYEPNAEFPVIINNVLLKKYVSQEDSARAYAISRGYADIREMANTSYNTIKEQTSTSKKSVCASITLQISQKLVMTREAFEGTLTINNGNTQNAMTKIKLNLEVKNSQGVLCNDLFQINTKALSILTGIDGTGSLDAGKTGSASILFIPEKGAAPQVATSYSFGGSFSYIDPFNGLEVTKQLFPISLDVNPSPDLFLHYFMQRDILGDDPLTEVIEPIVPGELALMIQNNGYGTATKVRVESAQPEIIDNQKGLAIHVALIGSNLNGKTRQLGLTNIDFGNIAPKTSTIGQWWFTSDLLGHFVNYETRVVHANSFGNPDLSLVSGATLHELIRSIVVYNDVDTIHDFLVNDVQDSNETPDAIYTSSGTVLPVSAVNSISTGGTFSSPAYEIELNVTPKLYGWNYGKVTDPTGGHYKILSVTRQIDGKVLPERNVWQTHVTLPDGGDPVYENKIHFVDNFTAVELTKYMVRFVPAQINPPAVLKIENVPTKVIDTRLGLVRVIFEKPIDPATFSFDDMILRVQGGADLMNNSVGITQIDSVTYDVNISPVTLADGYYVLTVQTTGIKNMMGESGVMSKQASWTQFTNTPAVLEFIGLPFNGTGVSFDNMMIRFTVPIVASTFTTDRLIWTKNGKVITGAVTITPMDSEGKLFKLLNLNSIMTVDGEYVLSVDLPKISSKNGVYGMFDQSVSWRVDTQAPVIRKVTLLNTNGYDSQHITSVELTFSEPPTGFGLSSLELWKDTQQQPISQLNITKENDTTYLITDFRLLTYYEGVYTLKINMASIADSAGNIGAGIASHSWTVNRNAPAQVTNLKISPDLGYSSTDGVTSTAQVNVSMNVNVPKARIRLYYNSFGTSGMLVDTVPAATGLLTLPVSIPVSGSMKLQAETVDTLGNTSMAEIPVYIDDMPLSASWNNIPTGTLRKHPSSVLLDLSDKILNEGDLKNNLVCRLNGVVTNVSSLTVTKNSDSEFAVSNFGNTGIASGGTFSLSVNTVNLNKYLSGKSGTLSPLVQWMLRGNNAPVANAGTDQTGKEGTMFMLDGSKSTDPDNDLLTYYWTAPQGITLSDLNIARPTFIAPIGINQLTFGLVVNDGVVDSQADQVVVNLILTNVANPSGFNNTVSITPNPSYNEFMMHVNEPASGTLNIRIYNNTGQLVYIENRYYSGKATTYKFSKLKLNSGLYIVETRINNIKQIGLVKWINIDK